MKTARTVDQTVGPKETVLTNAPSIDTTLNQPKTTAVVWIERRYVSARRRACWRRADIRRLADFRRENGIVVDGEPWLFVIAATLASAEAGPIIIPGRQRRQKGRWPGLDVRSLAEEADRCGVTYETVELPRIVERALVWQSHNRGRYMRADSVARYLNVVAIELDHAGLTPIGAIDETTAARAARRAEVNRAKDRERKRSARGCRPRDDYEACSITKRAPWTAVGVSRATWYRRQAKERAVITVELASETGMSRRPIEIRESGTRTHLSHGNQAEHKAGAKGRARAALLGIGLSNGKIARAFAIASKSRRP
jgi:hypothetical protein